MNFLHAIGADGATAKHENYEHTLARMKSEPFTINSKKYLLKSAYPIYGKRAQRSHIAPKLLLADWSENERFVMIPRKRGGKARYLRRGSRAWTKLGEPTANGNNPMYRIMSPISIWSPYNGFAETGRITYVPDVFRLLSLCHSVWRLRLIPVD